MLVMNKIRELGDLEVISFDGIKPHYDFRISYCRGGFEIIIEIPKGFDIESNLKESNVIRKIYLIPSESRVSVSLHVGYDYGQVAERIALSLEEMGYKVDRKIVDFAQSISTAPSIESFLLA